MILAAVVGRPGEPAEAAAERTWRRVTADGDWSVDHDGWYCTRAGLLLDRGSVCAKAGTRQGAAEVTLFGRPAQLR
ncbi:hypothetical protein ACFY3U_09175 [Micromonospora sp. NPDC000089]|uniref:hypothetical protein n=1 Tax=unclassified Micromonospora TaxID=2617518 RepID=UPI0036CA30F0